MVNTLKCATERCKLWKKIRKIFRKEYRKMSKKNHKMLNKPQVKAKTIDKCDGGVNNFVEKN